VGAFEEQHLGETEVALAAALRQLRSQRRLVLVLGILASHQPEGIVDALVPLVENVICTAPRVLGKTALPPKELAALCHRHSAAVEIVPEVGDAVERALAVSGTSAVVCVTGSLYLVGEARGRWESEDELLRGAWTAEEDPLPRPLVAQY